MITTVANISNSKKYSLSNFNNGQELYIYCGRSGARPSKLSNPFEIGRDGSREEVIKLYEDMANNETTSLFFEINRLIDFLKEKNPNRLVLGCHCKPKPCHCDVIKKKIDSVFDRRLF